MLSEIDGAKFDLFGTGYTGCNNEKVRYRGKFSPDELIANLDGQFGLVWDGNTIETCGGMTGNYLRYNNPHKLSLYITAGVPVILWKESALSKYVEENGIGVCVSSLKDIPAILEKIDREEYEKMLTSIDRIRNILQNGKNLECVLRKCEVAER